VNEADRIARAYQDLQSRAGSRWDLANRGNQAILSERRRLTRRALEQAGWIPLGRRRVLEVGSGGGSELAWLRQLGGDPTRLVGVDLLEDRVASARQAYPELDFRQGNAEHLEFPDASFDVVMALTVFSSIFDEAMAANVASEIVRVLRPGGALLWYDVRYDSVSNRNVHAVTAARLRALLPRLEGRLQTVTLLPPLARRLGPLTGAAYPVLVRVPPLRSHIFALLRKAV
jgi:ubiquinone/menaquinone biosynthesis C-methylase UbiE